MAGSIHIARAARILHAGGVIAYPTEAVFGIGCLPHDETAVAHILAMKRRQATKGLILIAADVAQAETYARIPDGELGERIKAKWPGPITWVLEAQDHVSPLITGGRTTIAMRVTAHPVARSLCEAAGSALVSTSANLSGREPIRSGIRLRRQLGRTVDMIVPGELGNRDKPTEIRDGSTGAVIRAD